MLLADAAEPPVTIPAAAAAVDAHAERISRPAERGEAPTILSVFPVRSVRVVIGEYRIVGVHLGQRIGINGLETAEFVLLLEISVANEAAEIEEADFDLLTLTTGHGLDDVLVSVLVPTSGIEHVLWRTGAVDVDAADDHVADRLDTDAERSQPLLGKVRIT